MIERRDFTSVLAVALLVAPLAAQAQQAAKVPRIGVLAIQSPYLDALRDGLREFGYVEGQNLTIEWRVASGGAEQFADFAAELARLRVDVIVAVNDQAVQAAQTATKTIPIVMGFATDPVGLRFVASLARPGGNITGLSAQGPELSGKRLQLLKEVVPNLSRVAVLRDPTYPGSLLQVRETEVAARVLGMQLQLLEAHSPSELDSAFAAMRARAVLVQGSSMLYAHRARVAELAVRSRRLAMGPGVQYAEVGYLMSYGANFPDLFRHAARFVDKILKGAKPADLPVEQPTKFGLVINLKTAKALGLTIPPALLLRADQVIE